MAIVIGESTPAGKLELGSIGRRTTSPTQKLSFSSGNRQCTSEMANSITSAPLKARPLIMASVAAGLAVTGALYGAGLKQQQETKKVRNFRLSPSLRARQHRSRLVFRVDNFADFCYPVQEAQIRRETTPADRIAILEQTRSGLTAKKNILETKIAEVEGRVSK